MITSDGASLASSKVAPKRVKPSFAQKGALDDLVTYLDFALLDLKGEFEVLPLSSQKLEMSTKFQTKIAASSKK